MEESSKNYLLLLPNRPFSPIPKPKLRRLMKDAPDSATIPVAPPLEKSASESFDPVAGSDEIRTEIGQEPELDPLFPDTPGWESMDGEEEEGFDWGGRSRSSGMKEMIGGFEKMILAKKRLNFGGKDETARKKKKNRSGEMSKESVRDRRMLEKERKPQPVQVHAESQQLSREDRDTSFRPLPLVQKAISPGLEKARFRKLEVLKKYGILDDLESIYDSTIFGDSICHDVDLTMFENGEEDDDGLNVDILNDSNQLGEDNQLVYSTKFTFKNTWSPLPTSSSELVSTDISSEEEDDDKENIDPQPHKAVNVDSYPEVGPFKTLVDDEAEEDDSDRDFMRFQENDKDVESDYNKMLNNLIATGFEDAPVDYKRRSQLQQKWIEQQDAAAADDVQQRLRCDRKRRGLIFSCQEEEIEEFNEDFAEEGSYDLPPTNVIRKNTKMAKQMIPQMCTDDDDAYLPSDDEETEQALSRQKLLKKMKEMAKHTGC